MKTLQRASLLNFGNYRYLKISAALITIAILAYVFVPVEGERYGGTWFGYVLGIAAALIVLLLLWFGIAKRRTPPVGKMDGVVPVVPHHGNSAWRSGGRLQGQLSLHVYLGTALPVLATLHTGFQFGWNVHMLAYVLLLLVVVSGFYGMYAYLNYPRLLTQNMGDDTLRGLVQKIAELDEWARVHAHGLPDTVNEMVLHARRETRLGGSLWQQLRGKQRNCPTSAAVRQLMKLGAENSKSEQSKLLRDLYAVLLRKEKLVQRARYEIKLKARLQIWLYLHVPMSVAMLAALFAHVVSILFYW
jgi:hypothetical protein